MTNKMNVSGTTQLPASAPEHDGVAARREFFGPNSLLRFQRDLAVQGSRAKRRTAEPAAFEHMAAAAALYSFVTVDYPGAASSQVFDSNGTTDVGSFVVDPATPVTRSFTRTGNDY